MGSTNGVGVLRGQRHIYPSKIEPSTPRVQVLPARFSATCLQQMQSSVVEGLNKTAISGSQWFFIWYIKLSPQLTVHNTGISLLWFASCFFFLIHLLNNWTFPPPSPGKYLNTSMCANNLSNDFIRLQIYSKHSAGIIFERSLNIPWRVSPL